MLNAASASQVRSGSAIRAGRRAPSCGQVSGAGDRALARIEQVGDAEFLRRVLGDLHEAPHPGLADGERIPLRFLVGERREQPPLDARCRLRVLEQPAVLRQHGADALLEDAGVDALDMPACARNSGRRCVRASRRDGRRRSIGRGRRAARDASARPPRPGPAWGRRRRPRRNPGTRCVPRRRRSTARRHSRVPQPTPCRSAHRPRASVEATHSICGCAARAAASSASTPVPDR